MKTSVLINNYNNGRYLAECVESVVSQSRTVDEIIVYDDGSSDNSLEVLRGFGARIELIAAPRPAVDSPAYVNQARAIDTAFRRCTGDLVFLLDSDDLFHATRVDRYCDAFARTAGCALVQAPLAWIDGTGRPLTRWPEPFRHATDPLAETYRRHDPDFFYPTSSLAFARTLLERTLPIDWSDGVPLWADTRLCLAAMLAGPVVTLHDELGYWRKYPSSDSARARTRTYLVRQTLRRTRVFNTLCRTAGRPGISAWRNPRLYLRILRAAMPTSLYESYRAWLEDRRSRRVAGRLAPTKAASAAEPPLG